MKYINYPLAREKQIFLLIAFIIQVITLGQVAQAESRSGSISQELNTSPAIVGKVETIANVESLNNYQVFRYPGANYVKVHFRQFYLQTGDYVTVSNAKGTEKYTYPGDDFTQDETPGFWALSITGDTAIVRFHAASSAPMTARQGFQIDKVAQGYSPNLTDSVESICGENQQKDVACYDETFYEEEQDKARAVAKLLINMGDYGIAGCTAWRVGPDNRMLTNHHCFKKDFSDVDIDEDFFKNTEVSFNYQRTTCGSTATPTTGVVKVTTAEVLVSNREKDFILFTVNNFDDIQEFGYLDIDPRTPEVGETIYIPQHSFGFPKQFGIESDTGRCQIDIATIDGMGIDTDTGYMCDTYGGSSGSPVIIRDPDDPNRDGKVIALHYRGVSGDCYVDSSVPVVNQAVRMEHIWPMIEAYMSPTIQFEASAYQFMEGAGSVEIPVKYTGGDNNPASVTYTVGDAGVEHSNYIQIDTTNNILIWENGSSIIAQSIPLTILDDDVYQGNREVNIILSNFSGAEGGVIDKTTITVVENDTPVADNTSNLCRTPNLSDHEYIEDSLIVPEGGTLQDLNIKLNIAHTWVGDMDIALEHVETGTQVSLFNRPHDWGDCSGNDLNLIFDDAAFSNVQQECQNDESNTYAYQIGFPYQPYEPLSQFNGETLAGTWALKVHDNDPTIDDPTLIEWCLLPEEASNTVLLEAADVPSSVCPGESFDVTFQMTIPTEIMATQVALQFDPAKLKVTNVAVNHAVMNFMLDDARYDNETGTLHFTAALFESPSPAAGTTFPLFTVTLEALQASESTDIVFDTTNTFTIPSSTSQGDKLPQTSESVTLQLMCQPNYQVRLEERSNHQTNLLIEMIEDNGDIGTYSSATNEQGQGQLPVALLAGNYTACVKAPHTLKKKFDFSIPTTLIDFDWLTAGDVNNDNKVDLLDFVLLYRGKHACQADNNYDAHADFDGNGCIELADALLLKANYDKVGDSCQVTVPQSEEAETTRRSHDMGEAISLALPADLPVGSVVEIPIIVGADIKHPVSAVTAYLSFEPQKIKINQVAPGTHLDFMLQNSVDETTGEIKIAATLWDNAPVEEDFTLATLTVTPLVAESMDSLQFKQTNVVAVNNATAFEASQQTVAPATCQLYATSNKEKGSQLFTVDLETHLPKMLGGVHTNRTIKALAIHHDTDRIYAVAEDQSQTSYLYQVDGQTGALSLVNEILFDQIADLAFSANGTLWAWAQGSGLIEIKPTTGESHIVLPSYSDAITVAGLTLQSKGDATIFFGAAGRDLWQYDMGTDALTLACTNLLKETESLETVMGDLLLFGAQSDQGFGLRVLDVTTCQDVIGEIMLPEAFQSVESFALPTTACIEKLTR